MKAKKKDPIYRDKDSLDEVVVTPYTKSMYAFQERMDNKATGGIKPSYPIFDALIGRALLKSVTPKVPFIKNSLGRSKKSKAYRAIQAALAARDVKEYTQQ